MMHVAEGKQAVKELGWLLDGTLQDLSLRAEGLAGVVLEATCTPRERSPVKELRLRFTGVTRFDFLWDEGMTFFFVPGFKAFILESGSVYVSLDPYDYRDPAPDSRDACVIEARSVRVESVMKSDLS